MRILFYDDDRLAYVVSAVAFFAEFQNDGSFVVWIEDVRGNFFYCNSMSSHDFDEYSYFLLVNGFLDLRKYIFVEDISE